MTQRWLTLVFWVLPLAAQVETGTHWAPAGDFTTLKNIGYEFAVTAVTNNPANA